MLKNQTEEEDQESEEEVEQPPEEKWDVESYVSTLTNTDNHPRMIQTIWPKPFKLELPKPEKKDRQQALYVNDQEVIEELPEDLTDKDLKKLEKKKLKEERRERRKEKKSLKLEFKKETLKQAKKLVA